MTTEESPHSERRDVGSGASTPPPTTSYSTDLGEKHREGTKTGTDVDIAGRVKDYIDDVDLPKPDLNPGYKPSENEARDDKSQTHKSNDFVYTEKPKEVDTGDKLDGQWVPSKDHKEQLPNDEEDDNCTVKCLYYTMQCCECSIS